MLPILIYFTHILYGCFLKNMFKYNITWWERLPDSDKLLCIVFICTRHCREQWLSFVVLWRANMFLPAAALCKFADHEFSCCFATAQSDNLLKQWSREIFLDLNDSTTVSYIWWKYLYILQATFIYYRVHYNYGTKCVTSWNKVKCNVSTH